MMRIPMPSNEEKTHAIHTIVRAGVPQKTSMLTAVPALIQAIGWRNIFLGMEDCIFLASLCSIAFAVVYSGVQYLVLFFLSPFFYSLLHMITAWKELQHKTYEIKMTCRYTLRTLTALRMLFFSGFGIVLDVLLVGLVSCLPTTKASMLQLLGVSLSALFFYGAITLYLLIKEISLRNQLAAPILWSVVCLLPVALKVNIEFILLALPNTVVILIFFAALGCYLIQLRSYFIAQKKEAVSYAVG